MDDRTDPSVPLDALQIQLRDFERNPRDLKLFVELKNSLKRAGSPAQLADLCELRAPLETDLGRGANLWAEAAELRYQLGDGDAGDEDLRKALALDPANDKASGRLVERLLASGRQAEAADVVEAELAALEKRLEGPDAPKPTRPGTEGERVAQQVVRRAARHRLLGQLWDHLGRVDRALTHWQRAWQLEPERAEAIDAARAIYTALGDERMVARLYELELDAIGDHAPRERRAKLYANLGILLGKRGEAAPGADMLERSLKLAPDDDQTLEALADVYAAPGAAPDEASQKRAVELFGTLARRRLKAGDLEGGIGCLRRALAVDPRAETATRMLEDALTKAERWEELERHYRMRSEYAVDDAEVADLLGRRAQLLLGHLDQREAAKSCFEALAAREPAGGAAWKTLRQLYSEDGDWAEMVALIERELEAPELPIQRRVVELLRLATIAREHLSDKERAAEYLHRVLSIEANNPDALARYADHFREKRDWRGLADLAEFAVEAAREAGVEQSEVVRRLEELAQVSELRLGDVERAITAWRRIEALEPENAKAQEAIRRLMSRARMWESLIGVLEKEATGAPGPRERADALKRIAQVFRERQVDPRKAIALYEEGLTLVPDDPVALKALAELYEREGDDAGVARTLRRQLEGESSRMAAEAEREGRPPPTHKEWPQAMRVERLTTLRRLAVMYENRLGDVEGVVYASTYVLELLPGDRDALERLERTLEKSGDIARLEQTLEYHAEATTGPAERAKVLKRLAKLALAREDDVAAVSRWERVLRAAPNDADGLSALADLYEKIGRHAELATVLERLLVTRPVPEPGTAQAAARAAELKRYAKVVDEKLNDAGRATRAWTQLLGILPRDRDALDALSRLYEAAGDWKHLADVLGRQVPLHLSDDRALAADLALRHATLLEERLGAPHEAMAALEALLREVDPRSLEAHSALRRLYEGRGDFEAAVRIAEREMYLSEDPVVKCARGLEIGLLCRNRLGDPRRALQAYERVLEHMPDHPEALQATVDLYAMVGDWSRHIEALQKSAEHTEEGRERRTIYLRIAQAVAERMGNPQAAFVWYRQAHEHSPDAASLAELRRAAEQNGLWKELAEVYEAERIRVAPEGPAAVVAITRDLVTIVERRLGDRRRALEILRDAVAAAPGDDALLAEAERIAGEVGESAGHRDIWRLVLQIFEAALEKRTHPEQRVGLLMERARIKEERLHEGAGALEELLRAFALAPERPQLRDQILRLAEATKRWDDALAVEATLLARAPNSTLRFQVAGRLAQLIEDKLKDPIRAYRAWLRAFQLAPEDQDTVSQLWRLARQIGTYKEADQLAKPEPAALPVEAPPPPRAETPPPVFTGRKPPPVPAGAKARNVVVEPTKVARKDATIPLTMEDLVLAGAGAKKAERSDPTIELRTEDLIAALGPRKPGEGAPPPIPPATPADAQTGGKRPPPPPRRGHLPGVHAKQQPPAARPAPAPAPAAPARRFKTAWEELAYAYESLPAPDTAARLRNLYRSAEVWERGPTDLSRAFETLAKALEIAPGDPEPKARLVRLAQERDAWDRLAELYEDAAEKAGQVDDAAALYTEIAEVRLAQKKTGQAETIYRRILGMRPDDTTTREKMEALYREEGRWVDLAASLEERTDPRLGSSADEAKRPHLLRELSKLYDEKLGKPYEAIAALEKLRQLQPDDLPSLEQTAELYAKVGRWAKVVEALGRVAELTENTPRAREVRRRVAEIYEQELELPDRAIDAYQHVVAAWPDDEKAYGALDALLLAHARWADLSEVLKRRASLAQDPHTRASFLRRRARVLLDWLKNPEEAVASLRHARTITPDDPTLADEMVEALTGSGRAREAVAVLEGRIGALEHKGGAPGDVAALLLRLAQLRADVLDDRDGAKRALEKVLARVPDHPSALAALARIHRGGTDPRAYADALLREAGSAVDVGAKVRALLEAGATFRDRVNDVESARTAFQAVLALEPANPDATWALSSLVATTGDLDTAAQLLERRLTDELPAEERARLLTELAALAQRAGVAAAADHRLREALEAKPDHVPAVVARADLLHDEGRFDDLETFLKEAIPRLEGSPAEVRAELGRRLAAAYEKLGRDDEAYARLLEADKVQRNDLLTKLALGENRYRARRWREAALHLGSLIDHADAPKRAAEVAEGLYHAALAEIRSLRPERAPALYEAALRLNPAFTTALHALAELEMERGNVGRAAELLEKQAAATPNHAERLRLFEALGDLALMALHDDERAKACFEAAVAAAAPLESKHLPLLDKLLARQKASNDQVGAGRTYELLASFGADAPTRAARARSAAEAYVAGGDLPRARAAAERAVEADPLDEDAVWLASELELADKDYEAAAACLGRALLAWDKEGKASALSETQRVRRAELWRRLGDARRQRGDTKGAQTAYEKSIEADPDSDGAVGARRGLLAILGNDPEAASAIRAHLRAVVEAEQRPAEVLALGRALAKEGFAGPVDEDGGRVILELAAAQGEILSDADRAFLAKYKERTMAADEAYSNALDEADRAALIADPEDSPLAEVMAAVWEAAPLLWTDPARALEAVGVSGAERVPAGAHGAAPAIYSQVSKALGAPATVLYQSKQNPTPGAPDVSLACVSPPIVVIGPRLASHTASPWLGTVEPATDAELRFLLGRAVELARPERIAASGLPPRAFARLVAGLVRAFGGPGKSLPADVENADAEAEAERLRKTLPLKVRMKVEPLLQHGSVDPAAYQAACERAADRAGLLASGDVGVAMRVLGGPDKARHLAELASRERYLQARIKLVGTR